MYKYKQKHTFYKKTVNKLTIVLMVIFFLAACAQPDMPSGTGTSQNQETEKTTGSVLISVNPAASIQMAGKSSSSSFVSRSIAPGEQTFVITTLDLLFKNKAGHHGDVNVTGLNCAGYEPRQNLVDLAPGIWTVTVLGKNASGLAVGTGIKEIEVHQRMITQTTVDLYSTKGLTNVSFTIDMSDMTSDLPGVNPLFTGTFTKRDASGDVMETIDFEFTINAAQTLATYQGEVNAGFYDLDIKCFNLKADQTPGAMAADFHDTICLVANLDLVHDFSLNTISNGTGSIDYVDKIARPFDITISGVTGELIYPDTMYLSVSHDSPNQIKNIQWRVDGFIQAQGASLTNHTIDSENLVSGLHEIEVIIEDSLGALCSKKEVFTSLYTPFTLGIRGKDLRSGGALIAGEELYLRAFSPVNADRYAWYLNGTLLDNQTGRVLSTSDQLSQGEHTIKVEAFKGLLSASYESSLYVLPPVNQDAEIFIGKTNSFGIKPDGSLWGWGKNDFGQIGDGTTEDKNLPVRIDGLTGVTAVSVGESHTLALKDDGTVWAWGKNNYGQLGDATFTDKHAPVAVSGLTGITAIAAGYNHNLALKSDGTVWAWGHNYAGKVGNNSKTNRSTPVRVMSDATAIAAGVNHSIALTTGGRVKAWGDNYYFELGSGNSIDQHTPAFVLFVSNITAIASTNKHSMALVDDGTVYVWGNNKSGQMGQSSDIGSAYPRRIPNLTGITHIAAGANHCLALKNDSTLWGWGSNGSGQLGTDSVVYSTFTPVQAEGLTNVAAIKANGSSTYAVLSDGTKAAWGSNNDGQLGDGSKVNYSSPVEVLFP